MTGPTLTLDPPKGQRLRVVWQPGIDTLIGVCHCGEREHHGRFAVQSWRRRSLRRVLTHP